MRYRRWDGELGLPERLVSISINRARAVIWFWLIVTVAAGLGLPYLPIEATVESTLDRDHPAWGFYQESQRRFGGDEIIVILSRGEKPFDPLELQNIAQLTNELEGIPGVRRVDSLASMPIVRAKPDGSLDLRPGFLPGLSAGQVYHRIAPDRIAPNYLASEDGRWLAVNLILETEGEKDLSSILGSVRKATAGARVHISGVPVFRTETNRRIQSELLTFVPVTVVAIGLVLYIFFRSLVAACVPLVANSLATTILFGLMGLSGGALTISTAILPTLLLALGAAYSMHLLAPASLYSDRQQRNERMVTAARPIALSGLTTAVGFVAISLVRIPVIRDVGGYGALGVLVTLGACLTACPAMLTLWPIRQRRSTVLSSVAGPLAERLTQVARTRRRSVIAAFIGVSGLVASGVAFLKVESDVILWFPKEEQIRVDYSAIRSALAGISPMNVVIEAAPNEAITEPAYVKAMEELGAFLERLPEVGKVISIADPLLQMHKGFAQDGSVPGSRDLVEQYLLLLESVEHTHDLVTTDRAFANVILRMDDNSSEKLLGVAAEAEEWWAEKGPVGSRAKVTGIMYEFARSEGAITWGQLRGLLFATCAVGLILWVSYRSASLAATGLVPNLVPVAVGFGAMGWSGAPLDAGTALLGSLVLGIAVDDTVHVLSGFERGLRGGQARHAAVRSALQEVLPPVVATTVAVGTGFAILGLSGFLPIRHLGFLTAGIMVLCLLADLLLLPALLAGRARNERGPKA